MAEARTPRLFRDLTLGQLRHLLIVRLPTKVGVECWGASHETLLEIAEENGLHVLSPEDIEEVGPSIVRSSAARDAEHEMRRRLERSRAGRQHKGSGAWKFVAQMMVVVLVFSASSACARRFGMSAGWPGYFFHRRRRRGGAAVSGGTSPSLPTTRCTLLKVVTAATSAERARGALFKSGTAPQSRQPPPSSLAEALGGVAARGHHVTRT